MATKIGDLFFEVSANTLKIDKSIAQVGQAAKDSGNIIDKAFGGAFVAAGIAATTVLVGIGAAVAAVGAEFNSASQRATGLFTALTGSAEEAVALMREFAEISLETPIFSAKALQDVSRTLIAYGVAKDDVVDMAVAIQSTATALGVGELGAQKLALALGQVKSRGFFSAEEARQLANYGVNAYGLIADAVGLTVSEVRELGRQHKLLSEDVLPILTDKLQTTFGPVAGNLINTLGVQVQGLKNTLIAFSSALVEPFVGRISGGAIVEFIKAIRTELEGLVTVGPDGVFRLTGALAGLATITQALADGFLDLGYSLIDTFKSVDGAGFASFADSVAGAIPTLVQATKEFASGAIDFFQELSAAAEPLYEPIKNLVLILGDFVINALPVAADAVVNFVAALAPAVATLIDITNLLLKFASPIVVDVIQTLADAFADLADVAEFLGGPLTVIYGVLGSIAFLATSSGGLGVLAVQGLALAFAALAAKVILAVAALESYDALSAGTKGLAGNTEARDDFLYGEASNPVESFFQGAARFGRGLTAGTATVFIENYLYDLETMNERAKEVGKTFADSFAESGLTAEEFSAQVKMAGLSTYEAAYAAGAYRDILAEVTAVNIAKDMENAKINIMGTADAWKMGAEATRNFNLGLEEEIDLLKEIKDAAKEAANALDEFLKPTAEATVDDFFRSLQPIIENVTDAMQMAEGPLKNLALGGALDDAANTANEIINDLVDNYGMSLAEIEAMFDKRGLAGVIEAMGNVTEETTQTVDPLIAKYASLGATAEQLRGAIARLNDQRQTAIKAQIDQVSAALRDAKIAAEEAKKAFDDYFLGGSGGLQGTIDQLVLDIPNIGDSIEAGLLKGGPQGEATIRQALSGAGSALGSIFQMGMEQGLSPDQIMGMLGPVYGSIQQELGGALNRISSLDWTEGFTPGAASQIQSWFAGILDPGQIGQLFASVLGSDQAVSGLEKQLEDLQTAASVDVEFSPAQVKGALDDLTAEAKILEVEVVTTPEAAQAVYDVIKGLFLDPTNELKTLIDDQNLAKQVMDAAEEGAKQTHLIFDAGLYFNEAGLSQAAQDAAATFINEFNAAQRRILDQYAQSQGFENYGAMQTALGPVVTGAMAPNVPFIATVNLNQNVTSGGVLQPPISTTATVAANSAGAGSGGTVTRTLQEIYGDSYVVRGATGPQ